LRLRDHQAAVRRRVERVGRRKVGGGLRMRGCTPSFQLVEDFVTSDGGQR
jgi:hypothetical protein